MDYATLAKLMGTFWEHRPVLKTSKNFHQSQLPEIIGWGEPIWTGTRAASVDRPATVGCTINKRKRVVTHFENAVCMVRHNFKVIALVKIECVPQRYEFQLGFWGVGNIYLIHYLLILSLQIHP